MKKLTKQIVPLLAVFIMLIACGLIGDIDETGVESVETEAENIETGEIQGETDVDEETGRNETPLPPTAAPLDVELTIDKWELWANGTQLRGADIWQAVVDPDIDGLEFKGDGPVGPPFSQADFDALAALGANYVNISYPGLYSVDPPYEVNDDVVAYLDNLLAMIGRADMFAVISFRTGPGRSEYTFNRDEVGDWFDESYLNDSVWEDPAAQDGWVAMWQYTAERYRGHPIVVGYDLMVEPNADEVFFGIWEPEEFYPQYAGTSYDWNELYPRISDAIRAVDTDTPILIGGMGYSGVKWLPYLEPTGDPRTVYMVHQYEPGRYTHQYPGEEPWNTYPGEIDFDWDGSPDRFDREWLDEFLTPVDEFVAQHGVPVSVNEYGPVRWVPGAADYTADLLDLFEERGMNHAIWVWDPEWPAFTNNVNAHTIRFGPDPDNVLNVENEYLDVLSAYWSRNTIRPSSASK
jgi:hypothetical protein